MTSLIIWDEAPMNNRCCFEALDRSLRDVLACNGQHSHNQPFGGKLVLLGGDFRQIMQVFTGGTKEYIIHASLSSSPLWHEFKIFTLNENMCLSSNGLSDAEKIELQLFAKGILMIRNGEISDIPFEDDYDVSLIKIPPDLLLDANSNPIESIVSSVYPCINNHHLDYVYFQERAIVTPKNSTVSMINDFILDMLPENKHVYLSCDSVCTSSINAENVDLLFRLDCVVTDEMDVTNFLMVDQVAENFFESSTNHYVYDKGFSDPPTIAQPMATKLNRTYIFQLRFGAFRSTTNRCDIVVTNCCAHSSDPFTPTNIAQKISFSATPLTITSADTQPVQNIVLVAGAKRKFDFDSDDLQKSDSQLDKSLEKEIEAQASQSTDDLSEKQKASALMGKKGIVHTLYVMLKPRDYNGHNKKLTR
uniref:ATP-dependent DNA helicase n=1 Tax=Salix viminalis TaxID=40686 RepID=A0A6N2LM74_SALVM